MKSNTFTEFVGDLGNPIEEPHTITEIVPQQDMTAQLLQQKSIHDLLLPPQQDHRRLFLELRIKIVSCPLRRELKNELQSVWQLLD